MAVSVPPRGLHGSLRTRQARPLNGVEIKEALETHILSVAEKMLSEMGALSDQQIDLTDHLKPYIGPELNKIARLQRINITYPKVGWSIRVRLQQQDDGDIVYSVLNGEVELDLERNLRLHIPFGQPGNGPVLRSLEEEKIQNQVPDRDRQTFKLPVTAEYIKPDGTTGKVDLNELKAEKVERRAARVIDVGRGAENRVIRNLPAEIEQEDGSIVIGTKEVPMVAGQHGDKIVTPNELPEISLDDILAEPPLVTMAPPDKPLPEPGSMAKINRPDVKFKK